MPKIPDWDRQSLSYTEQRYWTSQATELNPHAGFYTNRVVPGGSVSTTRGVRSYAKTPGYATKSSDMLLPLPYTATFTTFGAAGMLRKVTRTFGYGVWYLIEDDTSNSVNVSQSSPVGNPVTEARIADTVGRATENLLSNLKDMKINAAQATAERKQTCNTVASAAKAIAGCIGGLKSGNFSKAARSLGMEPPKRAGRRFNRDFPSDPQRAVANGWLSLQYGWKPLVSDAYGAAEALAKANLNGENRNFTLHTASGRGTKVWDEKWSDSISIPNGTRGFDVVQRHLKASIRSKVSVTYKVSSPLVADLASLGITNPALLAWELVPYSFVVDWFLPLGNWLGSLDSTLGLTFVSGYSSVKTNYYSTSSWITSLTWTNQSGNYHFRKNDTFRGEDRCIRQILTDFPRAPFPKLKNPLSTSHVASAMALLKQIRK